MLKKTISIIGCYLLLCGLLYAQEFDISASVGYLTTKSYDKGKPNYSVELDAMYHFRNHVLVGCGMSFFKSTVIRNTIAPIYDREVYSLFATAGYDFKIGEKLFLSPNVELGVSWIEASLNSSFPYEYNERFSPLLGMGCRLEYKFRHIGLFSGINYYRLTDNHDFYYDYEIPANYIPHVEWRVWHHCCVKVGVTVFL